MRTFIRYFVNCVFWAFVLTPLLLYSDIVPYLVILGLVLIFESSRCIATYVIALYWGNKWKVSPSSIEEAIFLGMPRDQWNSWDADDFLTNLQKIRFMKRLNVRMVKSDEDY